MRSIRPVTLPLVAILLLNQIAPAVSAQADTALFELRGKVVNALTGEPIAGVLLELPGQPARFSDSDGNFSFAGLPRGGLEVNARKPSFFDQQRHGSFTLGALPLDTYRVVVTLPGEAKYIQKVSASGARVSGRDLVLTGTNDVDLTIVMSNGFGEISGVAVREKRGVEGVMVLLVPDSGTDLEEDSRMDQSDSDGSFRLGGIIPGKYRLLAIQDGWSLDWRNPVVLKPYLEKAQSLQISANDSREIIVQVQSAPR